MEPEGSLPYLKCPSCPYLIGRRLRLKCDGTRAETRFRLSAKRTSPFKSAEASVQTTTGSWGVRISGSNAGYTMFRGSVKVTGQFPLHFPSCASPCAITFQLDSTKGSVQVRGFLCEYFVTCYVFTVSTSPNPQAGWPPLVGCPQLLIRYIRSYLSYWRSFLHPQPEDAPCRVTGTHLSK